jgi:ParB-like chromosome segregation protein Spo0J
MLTEHDLEELRASIEANGALEPIVMLGEAILDGRNRYMAARDIGMEYGVRDYLGDDPLGFVVAKNVARRHLSASQRAMIAAKIADMPHGGDRRSDQAANLRLEPKPVRPR